MKKLLLGVLFCGACMLLAPLFWGNREAEGEPVKAAPGASKPGEMQGELIYVPIYSRIYYEDSKNTLELAATLSIHNVNPDRTITVTKADYYNTSGKLIQKYVEKPLVLNPLETKHLVIEKANVAGGLGANFLVEWQANTEVVSPLVEALMVNASHNLGIAFTSNGKVIKRLGAKGE
jgi:hypothetical protein